MTGEYIAEQARRLNLRRAMFSAMGQRSMPMKFLPQRRAASSVVLLPAKGSSTVSPAREPHFTMRSSKDRGFCVS